MSRSTKGADATRRAGVFALLLAMLPPPSLAGADAAGSISGEVITRSPKHRANVIVNLEKVPGSFAPPSRPAEITQKGIQFVPRALAILKGTTVNFLNEDPVAHNVFSPDHEKYNLGGWAKGEVKSRTFSSSGVYHQLCNVHPEMGAVIAVFDNPFFAVTGADGKFEIRGVPPGTYAIHAWGEKFSDSSQQVTVPAGGSAAVKFEAGR
jgi:plastocyanin